jgi:light-regulated signal transduction histidine kinase (bacteriophytochrome)
MLEEDYAGRLDAEGLRLLKVIRDNSRAMGRLIDDLLEFSRLGRKPLSATAINMEELAGEAMQEVLGAQKAPQVSVVADSMPAAWGDPALIKQVWVNLLSNGVKFSSRRERPQVEVGGSTEGEEHVYFVRDNGAGFDMRYYDKLFGVFQRLHRQDEFEGTGVGLAIVQRVVSRLGGRVWAESSPDQGANFYFTLPAQGGPS